MNTRERRQVEAVIQDELEEVLSAKRDPDGEAYQLGLDLGDILKDDYPKAVKSLIPKLKRMSDKGAAAFGEGLVDVLTGR